MASSRVLDEPLLSADVGWFEDAADCAEPPLIHLSLSAIAFAFEIITVRRSLSISFVFGMFPVSLRLEFLSQDRGDPAVTIV